MRMHVRKGWIHFGCLRVSRGLGMIFFDDLLVLAGKLSSHFVAERKALRKLHNQLRLLRVCLVRVLQQNLYTYQSFTNILKRALSNFFS